MSIMTCDVNMLIFLRANLEVNLTASIYNVKQCNN